jgi:hypothetical protein
MITRALNESICRPNTRINFIREHSPLSTCSRVQAMSPVTFIAQGLVVAFANYN